MGVYLPVKISSRSTMSCEAEIVFVILAKKWLTKLEMSQ